ncbi:MAG: hypothetical protein INR71_14550, partial [Terriglobus roseus]|nr:hypothetical protein [Terriglobus roseus]
MPAPQPKPEAHKVYRREEDPEIAEQQAEAEQAAERAGFGTSGAPAATGDDAEGEDAPKQLSLKDRIAALQKQQAEQAQRRADAGHKEKPKRPLKKRVESHEASEEGAGLEKVLSGEQTERPSNDLPHDPPRNLPHGLETQEPFSDGGNDADMSAAGETTEDAGASSTSVEEDEESKRRHAAAPVREADVGDEEDDDDDGEEDEMDEEAQRQLALRQRMAKLSGGMGMAGMFGAPGGMPPPGPSSAPRKKKPAPPPEARSAEDPEDAAQTAQHPGMRMVAIPGMGQALSPSSTQADDDDEPPQPITGSHAPDEVADVEDVVKPPTRTATNRSVPSEPLDRPVPAPPADGRGLPPPIPGERPGRSSLDGKHMSFFDTSIADFVARPVPPPPPPAVLSPTEGSESDDEHQDSAQEDLPIRAPPPPARPV